MGNPWHELEAHAREARKTLNDPAFQRAVGEMYTEAVTRIRTSEPHECEAREAAYWTLRALDQIEQRLVVQIKLPDYDKRRRGSKGE